MGSWSLSLSSEPIAAKLVHRIQSGHFVKMQELLGDNIALTQHFEAVKSYFPTLGLPASSHPRWRQVFSSPSWIYHFLTHLTVGAVDQSACERWTNLPVTG